MNDNGCIYNLLLKPNLYSLINLETKSINTKCFLNPLSIDAKIFHHPLFNGIYNKIKYYKNTR